MIQLMASEELQAARELLRDADLGSLTIAERRRATASAFASPPASTAVDADQAIKRIGDWLDQRYPATRKPA